MCVEGVSLSDCCVSICFECNLFSVCVLCTYYMHVWIQSLKAQQIEKNKQTLYKAIKTNEIKIKWIKLIELY